MAPPSRQGHAAAVLSAFLLLVAAPYATTAIGVNYGTKGDNLPPPAKVASFLANRTRIDRVKLFDTNADMVRAFAGTGIALMVTAGNGDIPKLATKDGAAAWVSANVAPYYPATDISLVSFGNEIMATADKSLINNLVPAMRALKAALVAAGYPRIRVSTPHSLGILSVSEPRSASRFRDGFDRAVFAQMLEFHRQTRSPFMVNPYPYFGYNGDTLAYALARPNPGVPDPGTGITYTSMFEAQLDSVYSAMKKLGFGDVEIAVGETGWPSKAEDGQVGVSAVDAAEYNRYLIGEASAGSGTPLMPKHTFETYIFSLFNENLKPGPVAESNFGLFQADLTPVYDVGLMKDGEEEGGAGGGDALAAGDSSEAAAKITQQMLFALLTKLTDQDGGDGEGSTEKKPETSPAPDGAASAAAHLVVPMLTAALSLAFHM
ncbi:glucan endo-1,3-beta-glucosidase precursor [Panicum miliaceum]|uniref:glucan endo-1,3-beta-D-glucosidase n=1 Tax=Panicum miliaceum TaxID=4540 RepID=A0A3L6T901_PANMI|nr:glucan endo-1,3-beta-glucosidase precursor [Panicum miliaceum]